MDATLNPGHDTIMRRVRTVVGLFKLRIGVVVMISALAGLAITPGAALSSVQVLVLALSVLVASASAGAFNQYAERHVDHLMKRTAGRAFVTGALSDSRLWLLLMAVMLAGAVGAAWVAINSLSALFVFLGAFFYAVVYTVWLKRRSAMNIVIGGLSGSFAVLAGGAAVDPALGPMPLLLALVLFLWTPPHFWSLAIANHADYAAAGVPMLPVVVGPERAAVVVFWSTLALVLASLLPLAYGAGAVYGAGALAGGTVFLHRAWVLMRRPGRGTAMRCFFASMAQLSLLLLAAMLDAAMR
ncbi:MAG: protoheme IX farnesyltransferase [Comamonadaceae bacterium]|nr:protoheme IX farnesyltransferase [Comamonadaceae bacterium]